MGGYVVTSAVRILTDVFSPDSIRNSLNGGVTGSSGSSRKLPNIGKSFLLMRIVLVSPDIPAEALLSDRANFLAASLERFSEAHLFSNEGDEVLRNISTTANFFALPTRSRDFGYRLGNVGVLSNYGVTQGINIVNLRVGYRTLAQLYAALSLSTQVQNLLPTYFTYFDCTESVDGGVGVVTDAKPGVPYNLSIIEHLHLLALFATGKKDVHSGYFTSPFVGGLIYRLACIGYVATEIASGGTHAFNTNCVTHQIKALKP